MASSWYLDIVGSTELDQTTWLGNLEVFVDQWSIYGMASGATGLADKIVLTKVTSSLGGVPVNQMIDWFYFNGTKTVPTGVQADTFHFVFPRYLQVWMGSYYTPIDTEGGQYSVTQYAEDGTVVGVAYCAISATGYRMLQVVQQATRDVCYAQGGLGFVADGIIFVDSTGGCLDFFYLNNSKTVPATGLTQGQCVFTAPTVQGHYAVRFVNCLAVRLVMLDTGGQPIKDGNYYRINNYTIYAEVAVDVRPEPSAVLEMEFLGKGNGWTIVRDWLLKPGVAWHRGLPGPDFLDLVADIGTMTFNLDNSEQNTAKTVGYYSPDHSDRRFGFYLNIGVRFRIGSLIRFTGILDAIDPVPGRFGVRTVSCEAVDWMSIADRCKLQNLPVLVNQNGNVVLQALINSLAPSSQPNGLEMDPSPDIFPYTLDKTRDEETQLRDELYRLCTSGLSRIWIRGDGVVVYESRARRATVVADVDTFKDSHGFKPTHDRAAVVNKVQVTIHPRIPSTVDVVMYSLAAPIPIAPGVSFTVLGPWSDPANPSNRVGAASLHADAGYPVTAVTDYKANTLADGTGTDITNTLTVTWGLSGNATSFTISGTTAGFLTKLQQRGKPLYDYGDTVLPWQDDTSIAQFGVSPMSVDMPYSADARFALETAQFAVFTQVNPTTNIAGFTRIVSTQNAIEVGRSINRQISDRVGINDPVTGIVKSYFINAIEETESEGVLTTVWTLTPADTSSYWYVEIAGRSELNLTAMLGFGMIVGHTDIAHVDVHVDVPHNDSAHQDSHTDVIHQDQAHVDFITHYDDSAHSDIPHSDTHTDVVHQDGAHTDIPAQAAHTDVPHTDVAHTDYHYDVPHTDVPHNDTHGDQIVNVPGYVFYDHGDAVTQWTSDGYYYIDHDDAVSRPYEPTYNANPAGPQHWDWAHYDHNGTMFPNGHHWDAFASPHTDTPHTDQHTDTHGDTHGDVAGGSDHNDQPHQDAPAQVAHTDTPHQDVTHIDVAHIDVPHTDSAHVDTATHNDTAVHNDLAHIDVIHQDVAHKDIAHGDIPHTDTHTDSAHGDLH